MSKEFKNIDDLFQSVFEGDQTEVPDFIKNNIDKALIRKKRKRFFNWFLVSSLSFLLLGTLFYFSSDRRISTNEKIVAKNTNVGNTYTNDQNNDDLINTNNSLESKDNSTSKLKHNNSIINTDLKNENGINPKKSHKKNTTTTNTSTENKIKSDLADDGKKNSSIGDTKESKKINSTDEDQKKTSTIKTDNDETINKTQSEYSQDTNDKSNQNISETNNNHIDQSVIKENDSTTVLNQITESNETQDETDALSIEQYPKKENQWLIGFTGGINLSQSKYKSPNSEELSLYTNATQQKMGYEANLEAKYVFNNSFTLGSGVGFSHLIENYTFNKNSYSYDSTLVWHYVYDSLDTSMTFPIDSTSTIDYDTTLITLYNATGTSKAQYIHIPISFGTQFNIKKWKLDLFLMARFNYLISATGGYIQNDSFIEFTKKNHPIFKTWYVDYLVGLNAHYPLGKNIFFTTTFRYRPPIGNLYQNVSFNRSIQYTHIGIGFSLKL